MSGEKAGIKLLLEVETSPSVFTLLGGLRSKSLSFNGEAIDVTNHDSDQWKTLLDNAGIRSMSLSGSGVHNGDEATIGLVEDNSMSQTLTNFRIRDIESGGRIYTGLFKITTFERSGEHNAEQPYSISLENSGAIVVTNTP